MVPSADPIDFPAPSAPARPLGVRWIHGSPPGEPGHDPELQVHAYDEHTFVLRQDKSIDSEAPFLFLLFGNARAVLLDTGATVSAELFPLRTVVDGIVSGWLRAHPRDGYELLVLHTHSHRDHVAGDAQLADRPATTVVGADLDSVRQFFGFGADADAAADDDGVVRLDLGGRVLECLSTPGHDTAAVTYYDPATGFLLTGDTVYPGRLYIEDWPEFRRTVDRLIAFAAERPVTHVLGCHIEMTTQPGVDYPTGTAYQPDEPPLEMTVAQLDDIRRAIDVVGDRPGWHAFDTFVLCREDTT